MSCHKRTIISESEQTKILMEDNFFFSLILFLYAIIDLLLLLLSLPLYY